MRRLLVLLAIAGFSGAIAANGLDGRAFDVTIAARGERATQDRITFAAGMFDSREGRVRGFTKATYALTAEGRTLRFEARTASALHGTMAWVGEVRGDRIEGTVEWSENGAATRYTFRGRMQS